MLRHSTGTERHHFRTSGRALDYERLAGVLLSKNKEGDSLLEDILWFLLSALIFFFDFFAFLYLDEAYHHLLA